MLAELEVELKRLENKVGLRDSGKREKRPQVIVVDDNAHYLAAMADVLGHEFEILACTSEVEAISKINDEICAIILYIRMPGVDAQQVLCELSKRRSKIPVILNTDHTGKYLGQDISSEYKPFGYIVKESPFVLRADLVNAIKFFHANRAGAMSRDNGEQLRAVNLECSVRQYMPTPVPPFQLDGTEPRLVDAHGRPFFMSRRLHSVLKVMLSKEVGNSALIRGGITDKAVATLYEGRDVLDPEEARRISMNFRANLRRTFAKYGVMDRDSLIKRSKSLGGYVMGKDWHAKRPLVNNSEVTLVFRENIGSYTTNEGLA